MPEGTGGSAGVMREAGVVRNRNFMVFWVSETSSLIAMELTRLVFPLVAIITLGATAFEVGILNAVLYAPAIIFSLLIGVWLDRRRRRPNLIISNAVRAVLIGLIPVASLTSVLSMPMLYAVAFLAGVLTVVFEVGSLSYLPTLVDRRHLAAANGRIQASFSLAAIAGPSLGGVLVGILTAPIAFAASAVGFACSAALLGTIRKKEPEPESADGHAPVIPSVKEGLRAVFADSLLRNLLTQSAAFNLVQNALVVVFMVYVVRSLGLSPTQLGFVLGSGAGAALVGAFLANRITNLLGLGRTLLVVTFAVCLSPLILLAPRDAGMASMVLLVTFQAIIGFHLVIWNINTLTLRQIVTPNRLLGRMNASYRMVLFGTIPVGALLGGALGEVFSLRTAMVMAAVLLMTPIAWIFFSPVFRLSQMPTEADETTAGPAVPPAAADEPTPR